MGSRDGIQANGAPSILGTLAADLIVEVRPFAPLGKGYGPKSVVSEQSTHALQSWVCCTFR